MQKNSQEVSLYFHIPFCTQKCAYCHFYVIPNKELFKTQLMQGLKLEWERCLHALQGKKIVTVYFGGGTPALMGAEAIGEILGWIRHSFPADLDASTMEITLEANPENITSDLMRSYVQAGINRVSIGIQTLDNRMLTLLNRAHSAEKAREAVFITAEAGIRNISVDLMYDLPGQTLAVWQHTLGGMRELPITHLSLYNLTIEPHTVFFKNREILAKQIPDEQCSLEMYETAVAILEDMGLKQYEISAFSKEKLHSHHNVGYWTARPFLGLGPSAFSYWEGKRFRNVANLSRYCKALLAGESPVDFEEELSFDCKNRELLAVQLRLVTGVDLVDFERKHGNLESDLHKTLLRLEHEGFLVRSESVITLTRRGILFYDTVAVELI